MRWLVRVGGLLAGAALLACSGSDESSSGGRSAGDCSAPACECADCFAQCVCQMQNPTACSAVCPSGSGGSAGDAGASGGSSGVGGSGAAGGSAATGGSAGTAATGGTAGASGSGGSGGIVGAPDNVSALGANTTVGVEWDEIGGATSYKVYFSTNAGVSTASAPSVEVSRPAFVHRGLTNGTTYYYVVTAIGAQGETPASPELSAIPSGEWALEELGTGLFDDVMTGGSVSRVPIAKRVHVLLHAEGYTSADLGAFHTVASHDGARGSDVDRWVDLVFNIEPYKSFSEAFVVWYLPRASNTQITGGDTAFAVPIDFTSGSPMVGSIGSSGTTAARAWEAATSLAFPPVDFYSGFGPRAKNHVASFLIFDPNRGRAGVSGRATTLQNPANTSQRLSAAFGVGHAHEFSHAFAQLRDEYMETQNSAPSSWGQTSNVVGTNRCSELPWAHLVYGGTHNPAVDQLVGAFGTAQLGFHSELVCLMNGTHDNAQFFGGDGLLRVENRFCNFCREVVAYRVFERSQVLADDSTAFSTWTQSYRAPFWDRYGFFTPAIVPQTNNVRSPSQGTPIFNACVP